MVDGDGMFRWSHRNLVDLLDAQAEKLARGDTDAEALLALFPALAEEARPLMALASALSSVLQPVRPRAAFRAHLRRGLVDAARRRYAFRAATPHLGRTPRFAWLLGAAVVGSAVSVVGLLAYLLRNRHHGRVEQAVSN